MNLRCSKVGRKGQRAFTAQLQSAHTALKKVRLAGQLLQCRALLFPFTLANHVQLQNFATVTLGSLGLALVGSTSAQTSAQTRQTCCSVPGPRVCLMGFVLGAGLGGTL